MELAQQVISLEQAKKIKELWFKADSALIWNTQLWGSMWLLENVSPHLAIKHKESTYDTSLSAYSCSELMDILPETIYDEDDDWDDEVHGKWFDLLVYKEDWKYNVQYANSDWEENYNTIHNTNFAIALWDMLIHCLENNFIHTK